MIFAGHTCQKFKSFIHYNERASIICAQIVNTLGVCKLPKFGTQELHGLKLSLKLDLHISRKQIDTSLAQLSAYGVQILTYFLSWRLLKLVLGHYLLDGLI